MKDSNYCLFILYFLYDGNIFCVRFSEDVFLN